MRIHPLFSSPQWGEKTRYGTLIQTGQFTICFASRHHVEEINASATEFEPGRSEFAEIALESEPGFRVKSPRVAGSPAALECELEQIIEVGDSFLVLGEVVHVAVDDNVCNDQQRPDAQLLNPVARLGGAQWCSIGDIMSIRRIPVEKWDEQRAVAD